MATTKTLLQQAGWSYEGDIGAGGQAHVYKVRKGTDPSGPIYAAKVLKGGKPQALQRFKREVEAVQKLDHPGIVKCLEAGTLADGQPFYVMEHLEGATTLKKLFDTDSRFKGDALRSLSVYMKILEALQACEKAGIVHRDLSPGNVLILPGDNVKLIDFGCCFNLDGDCITLTAEAVGTACYRAPECADHSTAPATISADLYSAGKILWSLVTNKPAFEREGPAFRERSLHRMLPNDPPTWHLTEILENTIIGKPDGRYMDTTRALIHASEVRERIQDGYDPLESVLATFRCPLCGHANFSVADGYFPSPIVNPALQRRPTYHMCNVCGYVCIIFKDALQLRLDKRSQLEQ